MGYEDLNDHDELRHDPMFALAVLRIIGMEDEQAKLAGKSTLNRLEHCPEDVEQGADSGYHKIGHSSAEIESLFVSIFLKSYSKEPRKIILDLDVTDDLVHGNQEQVFFNTYYGGYCYAPQNIFCGKHLLAAKLRPSNVDPAAGALSELQRVIKQIRLQWKNVEILVRGDSAYSRDDIMTWCESQTGVDYVFGLARNSRLIQMATTTQDRAKLEFEQKLSTVTSFLETLFKPDEQISELACDLIDNSIWHKSLDYQTRESWSRSRRVVCKVEYGIKGNNTRFVVTSLTINKVPPGQLYRQKYCQRGEMENRFKEQQLELFSDRTFSSYICGKSVTFMVFNSSLRLDECIAVTMFSQNRIKKFSSWDYSDKIIEVRSLNYYKLTANFNCDY